MRTYGGMQGFIVASGSVGRENGIVNGFTNFVTVATTSSSGLKIAVDTVEQQAAVLSGLFRIHVPCEFTQSDYCIFGYVKGDEALDHIER